MPRIAAWIVALAGLVPASPAAVALGGVAPGGSPAVLRAVVLADPAVSPENRALVRGEGPGGVAAEQASVGDLTGDGVPDLVVPIDSGGPAGVVAWFVYARVDGRLVDLLAMNDSYRASVRIVGARLVETVPVYSRADRDCCPSRRRITLYRWDGDALEIARSRTVRVATTGR